jgi:gamma-butyrobetaine dioxygenase
VQGEPLTPDFYDYPWHPIATARRHGRFVRLRWPDGVELDAYELWLRENAVGAGGVDPATREGLLDPGAFTSDITLGALDVTQEGALRVRWLPDDVSADYHPGWLRHVADGEHRPDAWLPSPVGWTADTMVEPPTHDGPTVLDDRRAFAAWIDDLVRFGVARLRNCPLDHDPLRDLAARIGAIRASNFGPVWDVRAEVGTAGRADTNSTANTNLRLGPHTDLPTRETPPGHQFLLCVENEVEGGHSTMADGAAVVDALAREHPDHHRSLTSLRWVFFNRGPGIDHRWSAPMIDLGVAGSPLTIRAFYPVRAFPDMEPADVPRAYEALRRFSTMAASDRFQIRFPFRPGDLVGFDNRRILHGREAFESGGRRHLRGMYIDHDDVRSTARVARRRSASNARTGGDR